MNSPLICPDAPPVKRGAEPQNAGSSILSVVTAMNFAAPAEVVWEMLMFYEQIEKPPPWLLRALLPVPLRTEGRSCEVDGEIRCVYQEGHLLKRVTRMTRGWNYAFDVIEQNLALGRGIQLVGGSYTLNELTDGNTEVALETLYVSPHRPRWLCRRMEAQVCHVFHRHILRAMRDAISSGRTKR